MSSPPALHRRIKVSPSLVGEIAALLQDFAGDQGLFAANLVRSGIRSKPTVADQLKPQADTHLEQRLITPLYPYAVVVTPDFSALLECDLAFSQISLSFEPEAIGHFLASLADAPAIETIQANSTRRQTEFTNRLIQLLLDAAPPAPPASAPTSKLIEQSELLHQVTKAIGQSLELTDILKTAVHRVREFLQVDRLLIHQFDIPAPTCLRKPNADEIQPTPVDGVTYESCAREDIPSVLHQMGDHWVNASRELRQKYQSGLVISKSQIDGIPELAEVLHFPPIAQVKSELTVPILVQGELWGLLIAHQCDYERQWQRSDQHFLQQIVDHLSISIYQAKLFAQLQAQTVTLEQRVAARTQELRDALIAAQAADVAKSEFLATMSHELRTPLTCVIGLSATLLRYAGTNGISPERRQSQLQIIHDRGEALLAMINDILDLANIEAGRTELNLRKFSLSQLANQTLREMEEAAQEKQIRLILDIPHQLPEGDRVYADPQRLRQILLNLLSNAVKFTPASGSVTLRVRFMHQGAMFQVQDTGIGIAPEQQPLIFQKFQQLDSSYQRHYEGTGLGLALTKQLVELHGGKIEFASQVNVGSIFTVTLPKLTLEQLQPLDELTTVPGYTRVMLVETIEEQATLICDLLTAANYQVIWMADLAMAQYQLEASQLDLVIVNCTQMEAEETMTAFQQSIKERPVKFLAIISAEQANANCLNLGANDYLVEDLDQPELLVDKVMQLTRTTPIALSSNPSD
jgi:two-component system sensor histidine kinase/response regulator